MIVGVFPDVCGSSRPVVYSHLQCDLLNVTCDRYTAGVVGGLSTVAVCAPSEKFLNMGGPLAIGFGVVFCASIGMFPVDKSALI